MNSVARFFRIGQERRKSQNGYSNDGNKQYDHPPTDHVPIDPPIEESQAQDTTIRGRYSNLKARGKKTFRGRGKKDDDSTPNTPLTLTTSEHQGKQRTDKTNHT